MQNKAWCVNDMSTLLEFKAMHRTSLFCFVFFFFEGGGGNANLFVRLGIGRIYRLKHHYETKQQRRYKKCACTQTVFVHVWTNTGYTWLVPHTIHAHINACKATEMFKDSRILGPGCGPCYLHTVWGGDVCHYRQCSGVMDAGKMVWL